MTGQRRINIGHGFTVWQRAVKKCGNSHTNKECQKRYYKMMGEKIWGCP